jgi:hypothetical protein
MPIGPIHVVAVLLLAPIVRLDPPADPEATRVEIHPEERDAGREIERDIALLERASRSRISLDLKDTRLEEVIAAIGRDARIETRGDWAMLELIGANRDDRIDFRVDGSSPLGALAALGIQISRDQDRPVVEAFGGQVLLTLPLTLSRLGGTVTYDVDDLLPNSAAMPGSGGEITPESPSGAEPTDRPAPSTREDRLDALAELIMSHVEPERWPDNGGDIGTLGIRDGRLVITATPAMHLAIRQLLDGLREGLPGTAAIDLTVYRLPATTLAELRKSAGDPRSLAAELSRRFADRIVSAPRLVTRIGQKASISIGADGAESLSIDIDARRDPGRGVTIVDLAYSARDREGHATRANPSFIIAGRRNTETIIVPSAKPDEPATVLVADVTLRGLEHGSDR